jgi:hypothetical protein
MALVTIADFIRETLTYQKLNSRFHVLKNFINEQCVHQDETAQEIAGNKIIRRAANGTAKVAAPVEDDDIARKAEVDAQVSSLQSKIIEGKVGALAHRRFQVSGCVGGTSAFSLQPGDTLDVHLINPGLGIGQQLVLKGFRVHPDSDLHIQYYLKVRRNISGDYIRTIPTGHITPGYELSEVIASYASLEGAQPVWIGIKNANPELPAEIRPATSWWFDFSIEDIG